MNAQTPDLVVIGAGPAGYVPAIRAAQLGASVVLFEEDSVGGTCLNRGCIPTKTMVATTHLLRRASRAGRLSLQGGLAPDWPALARRKSQVVSRLRKGVEGRLDQLGVRLVRARATLAGPGLVRVEESGDELRPRFVLLAPGSLPLVPGPLAGDGILTSDDVLGWESLPESLAIIGGGVIGCEFASVLSAMGVDVTIVEMLPAILPGVDPDVKAVVHASLTKGGVRVITGDGAGSISRPAGSTGAQVTLLSGESLTADSVLVAVGRRPRVSGLGLDEAGVEHGKSGVVTDERMRTTAPGVFASGDVTGKWQLAHAGSAQGLVAVDAMLGRGDRPLDPDAVPSCIFTDPEIAVVGPGAEELERRGIEYLTGTSRYLANGRAVGMVETEGFLKLLVSASDRTVLGVQIVGAEASSLVGEAVLAVSLHLPVERVAQAVHPHPTLSELFMEAAESLCEGAIHG
ncbi:dihydrolipoyl dehydrogenase [Candidatus Fermentibacterales bacterium]|nr:dihydrolipoyl dehydrogenase [Candidatus Fermentibacterales bacterium]